jgi:signal peptidase II
MPGQMRLWLIIAATVIALDQISKHLAAAWLDLHEPLAVMPFFNLTLAHNTGAAFSFLADSAGWQRWFFVALALVVSTVIVRWLQQLGPGERWSGVALSLILGGALGNAIDRVFFGHVIDFIDVFYTAGSCMPLFAPLPFGDGFQCHWPAFNLADSAISVGAVIMVMDAILPSKKAAL